MSGRSKAFSTRRSAMNDSNIKQTNIPNGQNQNQLENSPQYQTERLSNHSPNNTTMNQQSNNNADTIGSPYGGQSATPSHSRTQPIPPSTPNTSVSSSISRSNTTAAPSATAQAMFQDLDEVDKQLSEQYASRHGTSTGTATPVPGSVTKTPRTRGGNNTNNNNALPMSPSTNHNNNNNNNIAPPRSATKRPQPDQPNNNNNNNIFQYLNPIGSNNNANNNNNNNNNVSLFDSVGEINDSPTHPAKLQRYNNTNNSRNSYSTSTNPNNKNNINDNNNNNNTVSNNITTNNNDPQGLVSLNDSNQQNQPSSSRNDNDGTTNNNNHDNNNNHTHPSSSSTINHSNLVQPSLVQHTSSIYPYHANNNINMAQSNDITLNPLYQSLVKQLRQAEEENTRLRITSTQDRSELIKLLRSTAASRQATFEESLNTRRRMIGRIVLVDDPGSIAQGGANNSKFGTGQVEMWYNGLEYDEKIRAVEALQAKEQQLVAALKQLKALLKDEEAQKELERNPQLSTSKKASKRNSSIGIVNNSGNINGNNIGIAEDSVLLEVIRPFRFALKNNNSQSQNSSGTNSPTNNSTNNNGNNTNNILNDTNNNNNTNNTNTSNNNITSNNNNNNNNSSTTCTVLTNTTTSTALTTQQLIWNIEVKLRETRDEFDRANRALDELQIQKRRLIHDERLFIHDQLSLFGKDATIFGDHFLLLWMLGKGGFSEVFAAYDLYEKRYCACKIHRLQLSWSMSKKHDYIAKVQRECDIQMHINHPHIVKLYNIVVVESNLLMLILEQCNGGDLDQLLKQRGKLPESESIVIMLQVLYALYYLKFDFNSSQTVIHFDLKPANILFHNGVVKVSDFGLSKIPQKIKTDIMVQIDLTSPGAGTLDYQPPECFKKDAQISHAVDMWACGVIMYQMLMGKRPFDQTTTSVCNITADKFRNDVVLKLSYRHDGLPGVINAPQPPQSSTVTTATSTSSSVSAPTTVGGSSGNIVLNNNIVTTTNTGGGSNTTRKNDLLLLCVDFIQCCLEYDPLYRLTVEQALKHPLFMNPPTPKGASDGMSQLEEYHKDRLQALHNSFALMHNSNTNNNNNRMNSNNNNNNNNKTNTNQTSTPSTTSRFSRTD